MPRAETSRQVIEIIDEAFQEGDVATLVDMYDPQAVQVRYMEGADKGQSRGHAEIRALYEHLLEPGKFKVRQLRENLVEADGVARFTSRWSLEVVGAEPKEYTATVVLRRQADGSWKDLIDTGPSVLD